MSLVSSLEKYFTTAGTLSCQLKSIGTAMTIVKAKARFQLAVTRRSYWDSAPARRGLRRKPAPGLTGLEMQLVDGNGANDPQVVVRLKGAAVHSDLQADAENLGQLLGASRKRVHDSSPSRPKSPVVAQYPHEIREAARASAVVSEVQEHGQLELPQNVELKLKVLLLDPHAREVHTAPSAPGTPRSRDPAPPPACLCTPSTRSPAIFRDSCVFV
ncbi:hypothetical protein HWI79_933 [Cryptosporidium felis]|nr:hypothetical protein HWI79_933 [Cryptosporidium felis]